MVSNAIRPTMPPLPSWLTSAIRFSTTLPKYGTPAVTSPKMICTVTPRTMKTKEVNQLLPSHLTVSRPFMNCSFTHPCRPAGERAGVKYMLTRTCGVYLEVPVSEKAAPHQFRSVL